MTATVTKVSAEPEVYRYLTLITEPHGAYVGMDPNPRWCAPDPCAYCHLGPLVRGKGIAPRR